MDMLVCPVCNSSVCQACAAEDRCHCEHKQADALWVTLRKKINYIGHEEESTRARRLLLALQKATNYAPFWITPLSEQLKHVPELSWRNPTTCVYCTCFKEYYVVYRVTTDKQVLGKVTDEKEAVSLLLPIIHALQCPASQSIPPLPPTTDATTTDPPVPASADSVPTVETETPKT